LNAHGVSEVRQAKIRTAEPLVSEPSIVEFELAIEKLKSHKSPGIAQIPTEMIKAGVEQFSVRFINLSFPFGIRRHYQKLVEGVDHCTCI
jgi:hypothetical protein